jgi:hypothetical protein
MGRRAGVLRAVVLTAALLAACTSGGDPAPTPTPPAEPSPATTATATASPPAPATEEPTEAPASPTGPAPTTPTATQAGCEEFGSLTDQQSADPLAMSLLTGSEMRVGRHECYERWVFEMTGSGEPPGWSVGYRDPLFADPAGFAVDLAGEASLEVVVRVWTVTDYPGRPPEWPPFAGPTTLVTDGFAALREVRYISAFEGSTQFGIGVDQQRPFRVFWLDGPPRLVVDVATG